MASVLILYLCLYFFNSSEKNKCYEVIKKLSDIHQSEKEYLKVRSSQYRYALCCILDSFLNLSLFSQKMAEVWLQLLQIKEEEAVDRKELLQLWKQMAQLLQDCQKDGELDTKTQQHVREANMVFLLFKDFSALSPVFLDLSDIF